MERQKLNKEQRKKAIIYGVVFCIIVFVGSAIYPYFEYLLPWNKKTVTRPIQKTAISQGEAIVQATTIVRGEVVKIEIDKYDPNTDHVFSIVQFRVDEVLKGDAELKDKTINTVQLGGTYLNTTYVYENAKRFKVNQNMILLLNQVYNLVGEPYSQLILDNDEYVAVNSDRYTLQEFRELITPIE